MQMTGVTLISSTTSPEPFFSGINSILKKTLEIINAQTHILLKLILGTAC